MANITDETAKSVFYKSRIAASKGNEQLSSREGAADILSIDRGRDSQFFKTPYREFITFHFTDTDITAINLGNDDEVAFNYWRYNGALVGKIVRIIYRGCRKIDSSKNRDRCDSYESHLSLKFLKKRKKMANDNHLSSVLGGT